MIRTFRFIVLSLVVALFTNQEALCQFATIINVPPDIAPIGIDSDTQLNLFEGGSLVDGFQSGSVDGSSSNIEVNISGGTVGRDFQANSGSAVSISGGNVGDNFLANPGSMVRVSGGMVHRLDSAGQVAISGGGLNILQIISDGHGSMSGGAVVRFAVGDSGHAEIFGGEIGRLGTFGSDSKATLSGGMVEMFTGTLGELELVGSEFLLSGLPIAGLSDPGDSLVLDTRGGELLTGVLSDGQSFEFALNDDLNPNRDYFSPEVVLRLTLVPEPSAFLLLCIGGLALPVLRRSHSSSQKATS